MTAPTHAAFGVLWAALAGTGYGNTIACALGALVPDIDHPQSSIGRIFFFLSIPINSKFGHRGLTHAFIVYVPFVVVGMFYSSMMMWIALGAISHIIIDCYNVSGVKAFIPFTEKTVICFKDDWRVRTGSVPEIFVFIVIMGLISSMGYANSIGGARKLINMLVRSPKITVQEFKRAGLNRCEIEGVFRWNSGITEDVRWLVVGTEGTNLAYWNGKKIIRSEHGQFMKSKLIESQTHWGITQISGIVITKKPAFWMDKKRWHFAETGQKVMGTVKSLDSSPVEIEVSSETGFQNNLFENEKSES